MAHTHRTGPELGPGMMVFYIVLCTVHTTQGQGSSGSSDRVDGAET